MKTIKSIQIIGTQRSGSNLLRVILNQLSEVDAPHPPHILERFFPLLPKYGDLNIEGNFDNLIDDICKLVELNPVPWEGFQLNRTKIKSYCKSNSLIEIFKVIYELKASFSKATYWCCKSMSNIHYADKIEESGIKPLYIYLYRDGRDVALSFRKAIVGEKHMYHLAKKWKEEQDLCVQLKEKLGNSRVFLISYEELLNDSEGVLKRLCNFLKVPYNNSMLTYYSSNESNITADSGKMWENLSQPIIKNNFNKFSKELSDDQIKIFEHVAGSTLLRLNYNRYLAEVGDNFYSEDEIEKFNVENKLLKQIAASNLSEKDREKRKGQSNLVKEIIER
ncbi:sulfotransferase family protein [Lutibacter flavus]|uniref:Sulfotransferase family protein n=1 Tax=Lutibacter flavus TaxID=691689 RepID=A0A238YU92_9FLAO|nr:sulfotransferase [Lutibacter flavus]SNR74715.1 Sulfotransferase family protein [Lutibacter flavus]